MVVSYEQNGETRYARVVISNDEYIFAEDTETGKRLVLMANDVKPADTFEISMENLEKFCRYEVSWNEIIGSEAAHCTLTCADPYEIKITDILTAMDRIKNENIPKEQACSEWYDPLCQIFRPGMKLVKPENPIESRPSIDALPSRESIISYLLSGRLHYLLANSHVPFSDIHDLVCDRIKNLLADEDKPLYERTYTDRDRELFLKYWDDPNKLNNCRDELTLLIYKAFADTLALQGNVVGLHAKGFGSFGGNAAYLCNWVDAQLCLDTAYIITGEAEYAFALGYIYYFGKSTDGRPDYERAFKYLSIGAAAGIGISQCLLSDMFRKGQCVSANSRIAEKMIFELYDKLTDKIHSGFFNNNFPETALRMGNFANDFRKSEDDIYKPPYYYYLLARFTLRMRRNKHYHYGDRELADSIDSAINNALASGKSIPHSPEAAVNLENILDSYFLEKYCFMMKIRKLKNGDIRFTITIEPNSNNVTDILVCVPEVGYCGVTDKLIVTLKGGDIVLADESAKGIKFSGMSYKSFTLDGMPIMKIISGKIYFRKPAQAMRKHKIALVKLTESQKTEEYLADGFDNITADTLVHVETADGIKEGTVISLFTKEEDELHFSIDSYRSITEMPDDLPF